MFRLTPGLALLYLGGIALGFAISDIWHTWWNLTIVIPPAVALWWTRPRNRSR